MQYTIRKDFQVHLGEYEEHGLYLMEVWEVVCVLCQCEDELLLVADLLLLADEEHHCTAAHSHGRLGHDLAHRQAHVLQQRVDHLNHGRSWQTNKFFSLEI